MQINFLSNAEALELVSSNIRELYQLHQNTFEHYKTFEKFQETLLLAIRKCTAKFIYPILIFNSKNELEGFCICCYDDKIQFINEKSAFFFSLMLLDDFDNAKEIRRRIIAFMRQTNTSKIIGPIHESIICERGIRTFNSDLYFTGLPTQKAYLGEILLSTGFEKEHDLIEILFKNINLETKSQRLNEYLSKRFQNIDLEVVDGIGIKNKSKEIAEFYNREWNKNWGFMPITEQDMETLSNSIPYRNNHGVFAYSKNQLIGFFMVLEEDNSHTNVKKARNYFIGVDSDFRKSGIAAYMITISIHLVKDINIISCAWMLESNSSIIGFVKNLLSSAEIEERKYRIFNITV